MPFPEPRQGEKENAFVSRCTAFVFDEGTLNGVEMDADNEDHRKRAVAACYSAWRKAEEADAGPGGPDACVCPDCGHEVEKERGTPCRSVECPECGTMMVAKVEEAQGQTFRLPKAAINNAKKVLGWRDEHDGEVQGMTEVGWRRARQLASGESVGIETVRAMAQFNRHRNNAEVAAEHKAEPWKDAGYVAWLGWGGTTGIDWALKISAANREVAMEEYDMTIELAKQAVETARACINGSVMLAKVAEAKGVTSKMAANRLLDDLDGQIAEAELLREFTGSPRNPYGTHASKGYPGGRDAWRQAWKNHFAKANSGGLRGTVRRVGMIAATMKCNIPAMSAEDLDPRSGKTGGSYKQKPSDYGLSSWKSPSDDDMERDDIQLTCQDLQDIKRAALQEIKYRQLKKESNGSFADTAPALAFSRDATPEDTASLTEAEAAVIASGRRSPVVVDFRILKPGPGNKRDNHYYPAAMLKRDIHVFEGADVFATDHRENERSERTKVGKVLACPTRFTEAQAPVGQVLLYDPQQAEKARNRNDAGALGTLECSIFGSGQAKEAEIDGVTYKVVEAITEGKYLELVSKAGAGGMALSLSESAGGDGDMPNMQRDGSGEADEVEEVAIEEADEQGQGHDAAGPEEAPASDEATEPEPEGDGEGAEDAPADDDEGGEETPAEECALTEAQVGTVLKEIRLPNAIKDVLARGVYADEVALKAAIDEVREAFSAETGSGRPTATGAQRSRKPPAERLREVKEAQSAVNRRYFGRGEQNREVEK